MKEGSAMLLDTGERRPERGRVWGGGGIEGKIHKSSP